jgi:D-alanine-D-alanine ligase
MSGGSATNFGRVGVLMGGTSSEREISLRSGNAVLKALLNRGIDAMGIDLTDNWPAQIRAANIQTAFIALHGTLGEDGCVQGMLEIMRIPYTGSGVTASALCMDKKLCKQVLDRAGLTTATSIPLLSTGPIRYPVILKPVAEGYWMAEIPVKGVEVNVSVLSGQALPVVEVAPHSGVYDFVSKYTAGATEYFCPARLPAESLAECMDRAKRAADACGCSGAPRVDLIVPDGGEPVILEVNTIPGMTETSLLPKAAARAGISFDELCERILLQATLEHAPAEGKQT